MISSSCARVFQWCHLLCVFSKLVLVTCLAQGGVQVHLNLALRGYWCFLCVTVHLRYLFLAFGGNELESVVYCFLFCILCLQSVFFLVDCLGFRFSFSLMLFFFVALGNPAGCALSSSHQCLLRTPHIYSHALDVVLACIGSN